MEEQTANLDWVLASWYPEDLAPRKIIGKESDIQGCRHDHQLLWGVRSEYIFVDNMTAAVFSSPGGLFFCVEVVS